MAHEASANGNSTIAFLLRARRLLALFVIVGFFGAGVPGAAAAAPESAKDQKQKKKEEEELPKCSRCGARCGLVAFCKCEPGTKKKPKVEYDVKCDPICVAGCGGLACRHESRSASCCDDCGQEACCNAWVRQRKVLKKTTTDEEVDTIKRTVEYVCRCCLEPPDGTVATSCTEPGDRHRGWFPAAWDWWSKLRW